ncbi:hypothetical protein E2562_012273 [Oryza meyeriana var. granulata]|uniref:Uncharacterized protein n=1 Tax=Oryza meyeriana var. granulata TaxID=110450 RepID=A0A6G1DG21_9ORYZ|nr:hypothetical protein E2562_012273 [Oryza meyeriana var. granulata]
MECLVAFGSMRIDESLPRARRQPAKDKKRVGARSAWRDKLLASSSVRRAEAPAMGEDTPMR